MRVCEPYKVSNFDVEAWLRLNSTNYCAYNMSTIMEGGNKTKMEMKFNKDNTTNENCSVASLRGIKRFTVRASNNATITVMSEAH